MKKEDITPAQKITELRLDMSHPLNKEKVFILLEGESDVRFYRKFFYPDITKVEYIPGGKNSLEQGIKLLSNKSKLMGIRDADFLHLEGIKSTYSNLFLSDYHDEEMMIVANKDAIYSVISEYNGTIRYSEMNEFVTKLLNAIQFIGYLRWYNERNECEFRFSPLNISNFVDKESLIVYGETQIIEKILAFSPNAKNRNIESIISGVKALYHDSHNLLQVCNGHDFMKVLAFFCSGNGKDISEKNIAAQCRISYSLEHFKQTQLFRDTSNWALQNNCVIYR
ncbi:DUF4435 domain-containing protein [Flectobacillus longus]|uniref:DUF4435 domain-containing protein n=1 Tax=Flectobacillus longus TaxID=2984207 RepID=UPI0024B72242|nr:DUF4435 domain-containing protein [Flectobacillus longus]MDI9878979.1 DUF4435 domain-containing protein [Flectobacillus longus]